MRLQLTEISKRFDNKVLFDKASFDFTAGKIYGLLGRNGSGKTTLFNCIAQNMSLDQGRIELLKEGNPGEYARGDIGFAQTQAQLPAFMTAFEFIRFFLDLHREQLQSDRSPGDWLTMVGIESEDHHRLLKDFSHGMQHKVQLLLPLMTHPPVLLLDEPLTSFDPVAAREFKQLIRLAKKEAVVIFSTHILSLAQEMCDEIVLLHNHSLIPVPREGLADAGFEEEVIQVLSQTKE